MEESISGFKERGSWPDIVEHGERITRALRESGASGSAFEEWEDWRPKSEEIIDEEVSEKTAEQASVSKGAGEAAGVSPDEDLRSAGKRLSESYAELEADHPEEAKEKWHDSVDYVTRAADSASRKLLRRVESTVYQRVTSQLAPYYFDNELVSANVQEVGADDGEQFVFEVDINDDALKNEVSERLGSYEDAIDRWHVDTEKEIATVEAAEGVEVTEEELATTTADPPEDRLETPKPATEEPSTDEED